MSSGQHSQGIGIVRRMGITLVVVVSMGSFSWAYQTIAREDPVRPVVKSSETAHSVPASTITPAPRITFPLYRPDRVQPCWEEAKKAECRRQDEFEACSASDFRGGECAGYKSIDRARASFIADCRKADEAGAGRWWNTCAKMAEDVGEAYVNCRLTDRTSLQCEASAVRQACFLRGGGRLCDDAVPVYVACRTRDVNGMEIARPVCIEGNLEYPICKHGWTTGGGDFCVAATAVYENCRERASIPVCEHARDYYANTHNDYW